MDGDQVACEINKTNGVKIMLISAYDLEKEKIRELIQRKCIHGFLSKTTGLKKLINEVSLLYCHNTFYFNLLNNPIISIDSN